MIRAIIFDWHGVLDQITFRSVVAFIEQQTGKSELEIRTALVEAGERDWARGELAENVFWGRTQRLLGLTNSQVHQITTYMNSILKKKDLWRRLPRLLESYKLALLSDCPTLKAQRIMSMSRNMFPVIWISGLRGMTKDFDEFYLGVAKELGLQPSECLVVDDQERVLARPKRLGFKTCLYQKVEDLDRALSQG